MTTRTQCLKEVGYGVEILKSAHHLTEMITQKLRVVKNMHFPGNFKVLWFQ